MKDAAIITELRGRGETPNPARIVTEFHCGWQQASRVHDEIKPTKPDEIPVLEWTGCYDEGWKGIISDASFAHPAKCSRNLLRRIIAHFLANGWIRKGQRLGEPFGGIGTTAIEGTYAGLQVVSNELEPRFCTLFHGMDCPGLSKAEWVRWFGRFDRNPKICPTCQSIKGNVEHQGRIPSVDAHRFMGNFDLHRPKWERLGLALPIFTQGDSRKFDQIVQGIVTSPPYATIAAGAGGLNHLPAQQDGQQSGRAHGPSQDTDTRYGQTAGQISGTGEGSLDAAITSPPYADGCSHTGGADKNKHKMQGGEFRHITGYGETNGQIGAIENAGLAAAITSPPWENNSEGHVGANKWGDPEKAAEKMVANAKRNSVSKEAQMAQFECDKDKSYGDSEGQIGKEQKESYWMAVRQVYEALYRCLTPGGHFACVVKDYVRDGKRVRLCDDTLRLLCFIGFEPVERIHAMLIQSTTHDDLFAGQVETTKARKSFFRRLYEKNLPEGDDRRIDFEEVLIVRKPL